MNTENTNNSLKALQNKACSQFPFLQGVAFSTNVNTTPAIERNFAFIDIQNLHKGVQKRGWKIDWEKFRVYLSNKFQVTKAVVFMGYIQSNQWFYNYLKNAGFEIEFRAVTVLSDGRIDGGNVDADITGFAFDKKNEYTKAVFIADDADYTNSLVRLKNQNKLKLVISSHIIAKTSQLVKNSIGRDMIISINSFRNQIAQRLH